MVDWTKAYLRLRGSANFRQYFGGKVIPRMSDFRPLSFVQSFTGLATGATSAATLQNFASGAVLLGLAGSMLIPQSAAGAFTYAPWASNGRRDMFALNLQYTGDEQIIAGGPGIADAMLGGGDESQYPPREIMIAPSQGILATVENLSLQTARIDIVYHAMVPRRAG
jgi:hypothetical protein